MPVTEPTLEARLWPGDGRTMLRLPDGLWVDDRPVTHADYARFVAATGHPAPRGWRDGQPPPGRAQAPVIHVDVEDARAYARWSGKRLPLQREFQRATRALDFQRHLGGGLVWEWTGSPHGEGHVVHGGPYRNRPDARGEAHHRSWEDAGARDLGFRCVAHDGLEPLPVGHASADAEPVEPVDPTHEHIRPTGRGAVFVGAGVVVDVDVGGHDLLVQAPGFRRRLGLSSAGLLEAVRIVSRLTGQRHPHTAILGALDQALARRAAVIRPEVNEIAAVLGASDLAFIPPLLFSHGVLQRPHLLRDLARLRPVQIALHMLDSRPDPDDVSPEYAALLAARLVDWQRLYTHPDSARRSVNRTLALHGEHATPTALWGLRGLAITAPLTSLPHLEVLSHVVAVVQPELERDLRREIVEQATAVELEEALVLIDEGEVLAREQGQAPAARLAEVLCAVSARELRTRYGRRPRFREVLEECLHALRHVLRLQTEVIAPPIPPPPVEGVRFLATVAEIAAEGVRMHHCVATRAPQALAGQCFLFHVTSDGQEATAQVDAGGAVVEVRGPHNLGNAAVRVARRILRPWGRLVALVRTTTLPRWPAGLRPADPALTPVTDMSTLVQIAQGMTHEPHGGDHTLLDFIEALITDVVDGRALMAVGPATTLWRLDLRGRPVASTDTVLPGDDDLPNPWGDDEAHPDDDEDWDMRT